MLHDKKTKKFLRTAILVVSILAVFLICAEVYAQVDVGLEGIGETTGLSGQDIRITIARIIRNAFGLLGIIAVALFVWGGYTYMTAGGDAGKVETARTIMKNAAIGIAIMLSAFGIAQFILSQLEAALYGRSGAIISERAIFNPLSGSLGTGIVQTHYPSRSQTEIPRNTKISITFKEPILVEDIIEDTNASGVFGDAGDLINTDNIEISTSVERDDGPYLETIYGRVTEDHRTFVFAPANYLGSSTEEVWYTISIGSGIRLEEDERPAFVGSFSDGYMWEFEVGTFLDLTPPRIESVVPRSGTHPRNIIVQINFNEAIDPTSSSGVTKIAAGAPVGFRNIRVRGGGSVLAGTFSIGNGYRSIEFMTDDLCGVNSCGGDVFCLPPSADILATVYAATPDGDFPYDGVVDMVGNSFDGNNNGVSNGPTDDNFEWAFRTNNTIDLTPPRVENITPDINEGEVELDVPVEVTFSKIMSVTTLNTSNVSLIPDPLYEFWFDTRTTNLDETGEPAGIDTDPTRTRLNITHAVLSPSDDEVRFDYHPGIASGVKDVTQNCFFPGRGGVCEATAELPYCCNGVRSGEKCDFLP